MADIERMAKLQTQIEDLKKQRDQVQAQANFQLGAFAGKIELLEEQLSASSKPSEEPPASKPDEKSPTLRAVSGAIKGQKAS